MRLKAIIPAMALAVALCGWAAPQPARADVAVSISFFHDHLAPYGHWASVAAYGNVWIPGHVSVGWAPYVDGQWIYTDYGWTWVSDDPWGDVAYHYGTWAWASPYGWVWIPGTVWAPAWVTWAYTDDYIGWAPVPPSFVLSVGGYVGSPIVVSETRYVFVPSRQFVGVPVSRVRVAPQQNATIFRQATKATSFRVSDGIVRTAGLPAERVERAAGRPVERVSIDRARTRPTSFESGGVQKAKSIPVVAPARERAKAAPAARSEARTEHETRPQEQASRDTKARPAPAPRQHEVEHKDSAHNQKTKSQPAHVESKQPERREAENRSRPPEKAKAHAAPAPHSQPEARVEHQPAPERNAENRSKPAPQKEKPHPKPEKKQPEKKQPEKKPQQ